MFKKFITAVNVLLLTVFVSGPVGLYHGESFAHGHGHYHCKDCGHHMCPGNCGRCEECLAERKTARKAAGKCEKCGHEGCPTNCNRCADCLHERIRKLEREKY
ncbi:MAG: hypothetical protein E3K32_10870 [wastewater metagenome]|nr:hypothetical protein [Candidatus Loosdrechtia aerotolerans]